ncbi:IS110 family transposase [Streptomyces poonensis]
MTQQPPARHHTAHQHEQVLLGVDTHKDVHMAAVITSTGAVLDTRGFPTTRQGYRRLLAWARAFGRVDRAGVECTGSYGAALTRYLHGEGITVTEVNQPDKAARRRHGKSDAIDAVAAARAVLCGRATAKTADGPVETIRLFTMAKTPRRQVPLDGPQPAQGRARDGGSGAAGVPDRTEQSQAIRRCAQLSAARNSHPQAASRHTLRTLARRILHLTEEINDLTDRITTAIDACAPQLLGLYGVGPDTAAALLTAAGGNPHRMTNEASFAALCGVSPVEASSGKVQRRRLNRGGDRRANSALCTIVIARLRWDTRTRAYVDRRVREGKTRREGIRCLKRYVAREIYRALTTVRSNPPASASAG